MELFGVTARVFREHRKNSELDFLDAEVFEQALISSLSSDREELRTLAKSVLINFHKTIITIVGSVEAASVLPIYHNLASKFCSACYRPQWFQKMGGCRGIAILMDELNLGSGWLLKHEIDFVKACLYICKDLPPDMADHLSDEVGDVLLKTVRNCNSVFEEHSDLEFKNHRFNSLLNLLTPELSNSNQLVRKNVQSMISLLSELRKEPVSTILLPVSERLLTPIFSKPLRALLFSMQIGHIDAITYCLTLNPPLLEFNDELKRLLKEVQALADADDQSLLGAGKSFLYYV